MGFTNVAWESRDTVQLARDLTDGPGPMSVGQAGAAWVRVADELTGVSQDYDKIVEKFKNAFVSRGADAAAGKLEEYGRWLQAVSLSAAGNGQQAEQAAVAYSVAVLAMPSVSEAIEAKTTHDVMASLAAYNGAILNGQFAEFDETATGDQANASAVMYQYEDACGALAAPWEQPAPPEVTNGAALQAEQHADANDAADAGDGGVGAGAGSVGMAPPALAPFQADDVRSSKEPKALQQAPSASGGASAGTGPTGGGYGPMGALGRPGAMGREHQSSLVTATLDGGGEPGASLSPAGGSWLPAAQSSDAPFVVSDVSWGPSTTVFDDLAVADEPDVAAYADEPARTLEQVSDRWVSPPVIGTDRGLTL
jgi:hypothetical protein